MRLKDYRTNQVLNIPQIIDLETRYLGFNHVPWLTRDEKHGMVMGVTELRVHDSGDFEIQVVYFPKRISTYCKAFGRSLREELVDTVRHELAHVAHLDANMPAISDRAYQLRALGYSPRHASTAAHNEIMRGPDSSHGTVWRSFARRNGAYPRAGGVPAQLFEFPTKEK